VGGGGGGVGGEGGEGEAARAQQARIASQRGRRGFSEGAANARLACSKRGAASAAQQVRRSKRGAASAAQQARRSKRGAGALAGEAAKFELVCCGQRCSVGTGACVPWRRGQRGDAPAAGGLGEGAGGSPGDARARGAQAWAVLDTLGCGQGCVQAQSAQGMGAQKRGAALPLGSGKARGVGVRRRGAARGVAAQHRGSRGHHALSSAHARRRREGRVWSR
jgi:hypothetical protein